METESEEVKVQEFIEVNFTVNGEGFCDCYFCKFFGTLHRFSAFQVFSSICPPYELITHELVQQTARLAERVNYQLQPITTLRDLSLYRIKCLIYQPSVADLAEHITKDLAVEVQNYEGGENKHKRASILQVPLLLKSHIGEFIIYQ